MPPFNMDALMDEGAQQLRRRQPIINKNLRTVRVPVNTFRQTTYHNLNHNEPQTVLSPQSPNGIRWSNPRRWIRQYSKVCSNK